MTQDTSPSSSPSATASTSKTRKRQRPETFAAPQKEQQEAVTNTERLFSQQAEGLHTALAQQGHALFAENIKLSKDFFSCKTVNDLLDLQARILHLNSTAYLKGVLQLTGSLYPDKQATATDSRKDTNNA